MKTDKTPKAELIAFYSGGAKVHATTTLTKAELETKIEEAFLSGYVKIDTVNEDQAVADDSLTLLFDKMLFYTVLEKNDSKIMSINPTGKIIT